MGRNKNYTDIHYSFILTYANELTDKELVEKFNEKFKTNMSRAAIRKLRQRFGIAKISRHHSSFLKI